jgi:hypothetical protein
MKTTLLTKLAAAAFAVMLTAGPVCSFGQTNLNFNGVSANVEGAIRLSWNSTSNEIYEIDYADSLIDTNTGSITWSMLYEEYPSQGTNTFCLDTGNYSSDPEIVHPSQFPTRFYRVVLTGSNMTATVPKVLITSPTNNADINGVISVGVTAVSDQFFLSTKLYVDGQEMNTPDVSTNWTDSGTNYITDTYNINSCEWPNGPHTLFATARCQSGLSGAHDFSAVTVGYGVSSFVPVTFDNLITRVAFSQPLFTPEDGQTQNVSAIFAANVNWTLEIQDADNNDVRTTNGSGGTLSFAWDGTGNGGTNLPVGTYTYLITAATNGLALPAVVGGGDGGGGSLPSPDFAMMWAMPSEDSGDVVPLALYPPGFDTNSLTIFEATTSEMTALRDAVMGTESRSTLSSSGGGGGVAASYSGGSSQSSRSPTRPPIKPVKGRAGVYGVAYQTFSANGTNGFSLGPPLNGILSQHVGLEGFAAGQSTFSYPPLAEYKRESANFVESMKKGNWSQGFAKVDDKLAISDLRGSGTIYNSVKLGLLMLHGTYGTSQDFTSGAGGSKQMYFPITSGHGAAYLRMSEMSFGSSDTNGLKWMAIAACNSLFHTDWNNMQSMGVKPYNANLHLFLGTDTVVWTDDHIMEIWAKYMTKGKGTNATPMKIKDAWINAAKDAYAQSGFNYTNAMKFAYAGDTSCIDDTTSSTTTPGGTWTYSSQTVWP